MPNRLSAETSPYLLQHAENPVEWYPWGEEALTKARREDKPILLSIGYSACHWCHVMERESFEDESTATLMNRGFVNIKVDREERPDLDSIYMRAVQASMGRGGWPLTAFLTPDGKFFYGGTYFPPEPRFGMPSFSQVLASVLNAFRTRRGEIEAGSDQLLAALRGTPPLPAEDPGAEGPPDVPKQGAEAPRDVAKQDAETPPDVPKQGTEAPPGSSEVDASEEYLVRRGSQVLDFAARHLGDRFDPAHGGFGPAPKFPQPVTLEFLLRHFDRTGDREVLGMVLTTLRCMARGGMRDHLAGGFHRYSVDDRWLVPHFEKMLYDNGLLARVYLHAFQTTGDPEFRDIAESTLDYVLADLRDQEGGFYSARDADSEGEEGLFYLWRPDEVKAVLGEDEAAFFSRVYDVSQVGNFEGRSILHLSRGLDSLAETEGVPLDDLAYRLNADRARLRRARDHRETPFRDEKVLVSWNSLVLRALAEAGSCLARDDYLDAARKTGDFLLRSLRKDGRLHRTWKNGQSKIPAFLEDYAGLGNALLTLYEATLEPRWLDEAKDLADQVVELFWEEDEGLFFDSPRDGEQLVVRPRESMDSATPSGNSLAIELLLRTAVVFGADDFRRIAVRALLAEIEAASRFPSAFGRYLSTMAQSLTPSVEVVLLGDPETEETKGFLSIAHQTYIPARIVAGGNPGTLPPLPLLEGREPKSSTVTAYVCRDFACTAPLFDPEELARELEESARKLEESARKLEKSANEAAGLARELMDSAEKSEESRG